MSAPPTHKIAFFGSTGHLGQHVLRALTTTPHTITLFLRTPATNPLPPRTTAITPPFTLSSLTTALETHTLIISTLSPTCRDLEATIISAARAARIPRIIPSIFAYPPSHRGLPELEEIWKSTRELFADLQTGEGGLEYTVIAPGLFFDAALERFAAVLGVDVDARRLTVYDGGKERFSGTTQAGIARGVLGVLERWEETRGKVVGVSEWVGTHTELLKTVEEVMGGEWVWEEESTEVLKRKGRAGLVAAQLLEAGAERSVVEEVGRGGNELLGIPGRKLEDIVREAFQGKGLVKVE